MLTIPPVCPAIRDRSRCGRGAARLLVILALAVPCGCTSLGEWSHNGFKVGPNYKKPPVPLADEWIDSKAKGVSVAVKDLNGWWLALRDTTLNELILEAYQQNLTLRSAGTRILAARAQRNIAAGFLFPQQQQAFGDHNRNQTSATSANPLPHRFFNDTAVGVNLSWELDFWGRFRRGVEAADAELDASIENYDDALVLLISEVASTYVQYRVFQKRLQYVADNITVQTKLVKDTEDRLEKGAGDKLDQSQMRSNLYDTLALKEQFEIGLRQTNNQLCVLLGMPVRDLSPRLGQRDIPIVAVEAAVGMPADLLRRRPDLRRAERLVAAQSARIGIATANLYPRLSLVGAIGYESENFRDLFTSKSFIGTIGPSLRWDILNYGRLVNGIRVQDALFQTAAVDYQNAVLSAGREVEDNIVLFLRSQSRTKQLIQCELEARSARDVAIDQSREKKFDVNRLFVTSNFLVGEQDKLAQSRGDIVLGFIQIYKALGGGWEIRCAEPPPMPPVEMVPAPQKQMPMAPRMLPAPAAVSTAGILGRPVDSSVVIDFASKR